MTKETEPKLDPSLEPPAGTIVQTGDEDIPTSEGGKHDDHLKAIFSKARKNRELITREDEDENPDAEMMAKMVEESQDLGEYDHGETKIDLDARPDRFADGEGSDDPEYVEVVDHENDELDASRPEAKEPDPEPDPEKKLEYDVENGKVNVKIEGREYIVPQADIEDAGGVENYQLKRSSNIRFEKAATYAKALQKEREEFEQQQSVLPAKKGELPDPESDVLSKEAELKDYRERILDAALDGTEADIDEILQEAISKPKPTESKPQNSRGEADPVISDRVVEEFETAYQRDRQKANRLLMDDYSDIMSDRDLKEIAHRKYLELDADPSSYGRTAVEKAREAGDFVRRLTHTAPPKKTIQDRELETRRERKRVLPQPSDARKTSRPPEKEKPRSNRDYIRSIQRAQGQRR